MKAPPREVVVTGDDALERATLPLSRTILDDLTATCRMFGRTSVSADDIVDLTVAVSELDRMGASPEVAALVVSSFHEIPSGAPERNGRFVRLLTACHILSLADLLVPVRIVPSRAYAEVLSGDGEWEGTAPAQRACRIAETNVREAGIREEGVLVVGLHVMDHRDVSHLGVSMTYADTMFSRHLSVRRHRKTPESISLGMASMLRRMKMFI